VKRHLTDDYDPKIARIDDIASQASSAATTANQVNAKIDSVVQQTQTAFNGVGATLGNIQSELAKLQERSKEAPMAHGRHHGPVIAGPGEYIVKRGDSGMRIARAHGVSLHDLEAVNPGINWKRLRPGEKIKLPERGGAAAAEAPAQPPAPAPAPGADE
ncbi:MAG: LysM peptidoglycan-binding domain-containing protein, partial [Opitutaceae bacterium]